MIWICIGVLPLSYLYKYFYKYFWVKVRAVRSEISSFFQVPYPGVLELNNDTFQQYLSNLPNFFLLNPCRSFSIKFIQSCIIKEIPIRLNLTIQTLVWQPAIRAVSLEEEETNSTGGGRAISWGRKTILNKDEENFLSIVSSPAD